MKEKKFSSKRKWNKPALQSISVKKTKSGEGLTLETTFGSGGLS